MLDAEPVEEKENEETELVVADEPKPQPKPTPGPASRPDPQPKVEPKVIPVTEPESSSWKKWAGVSAVGLLVVIGIIFWPKGEEKQEPIVRQVETRQQSEKPIQTVSSQSSLSSSIAPSNMGTINGHKYVDLGLSVKWADCNVGANSPSDYGDYFAWGETSTKSDYRWTTYKWCKGTGNSMTKYCTDSKYGTVDNRRVLSSSDDVARVKWGGSWRMPTVEEFKELCDKSKCTWTWTTQGGHKGYKVTGPNGNSIFLPAAGYRDGTDFYNRGSHGLYWSATLYEDYSRDAYHLYFYDGDSYWNAYWRRYLGHTVRPVTE